MKVGATVAIIQNGQILLTKRSDFEVWCLPGGHVDPGESPAQTAVREAKEEVGLDVRLTRQVGVYTRIGGDYDMHLHLFAAEVVGGTPTPQPEEVLEIATFAPDALPEHMFWWHRPQVADALSGVTGAVWRFEVVPAEVVNGRQELYALQARLNLPPTDFYRYFFEKNGTHRVQRLL